MSTFATNGISTFQVQGGNNALFGSAENLNGDIVVVGDTNGDVGMAQLLTP